jgi:hypothetical protein
LSPSLGYTTKTVRSCVLIKPRPKKDFPDRFVWAFSQKGLRSRRKKSERGARPVIRTPPDLGEALVTECPYEAVGKTVFDRGLIRTQERTVRINWSGVEGPCFRR